MTYENGDFGYQRTKFTCEICEDAARYNEHVLMQNMATAIAEKVRKTFLTKKP
jgi:hypothetical protein